MSLDAFTAHEIGQAVISVCERAYGIENLRAYSRKKHEAEGRRMAYVLLRGFGLSYPEIGDALDRDHTTVLKTISKPVPQAIKKRLLKEVKQELSA